MDILFATSELYPLIKTGGLADVSASLPAALAELGENVKVMLPAYGDVLAAVDGVKRFATLKLAGHSVALLRYVMPVSKVEVWLVETERFARRGNPYLAPDGSPWRDNAGRFGLFARAVAATALGHAATGWRPQVLHCQDWQTGLAPALLATESRRPAVVYTIHNLSYQGNFSYATFLNLDLPAWLWNPEALEFNGQLSFMKGGLVYADYVSTVSPGYAREIQTPQFGCGLEGILTKRSAVVSGIVNGIDVRTWNPLRDPYLIKNYDDQHLNGKHADKAALQRAFNLPQRSDTALVGMIGRLVEQKGIDLLVDALPELSKLPLQIVLLGTGERHYERVLQDWAQKYSDQISVRIGYDEALAHQIEAGADIFLMPSRFEPCGLNQMYSQRYGTVPIVRRTGGLQDTVSDPSIEPHGATGIVFNGATGEALLAAVRRALSIYMDKATWRTLMINGMRRDFSWQQSAQQYVALYRRALDSRASPAPH